MEQSTVEVEPCSASSGGNVRLEVGLAVMALVAGVLSRYWSMWARKGLVLTRVLCFCAGYNSGLGDGTYKRAH